VRNDENMKRMFFYGTPCIVNYTFYICIFMCNCNIIAFWRWL